MSAADRTKENVEQTKETAQRNFIAATDSAEKNINKGIDAAAQSYDQTKEAVEKNAEKAKDVVEKNAEQAKQVADRNIEEAKQNAEKAKRTVLQKLRDDGVVNPKGLAFVGFGSAFFAAIPLTSWIAQPGGLLGKAVNGVVSSVAFLGSAGATKTVPQTGKIAALGALYVAVTFAISGANSVAGVASSEEGRDNKYPRKNLNSLSGLPLRLWSAHYNLMEMFPSWAIAAALTQAIAPTDAHLINLLGLHVIAKVFLYYPSYLFNVAETRSLAHVLATGSVIGVLTKLIQKPLI